MQDYSTKKQTLWYLIVKLSQKSENNVTPLHTWQESNTVDKFNTSAVLTINIEDGDDQYPHFLPCTPVSPGVPVCMNPTYTANITQKHQVNTRGTRWMQLFTKWLLKTLPDRKMSIKTAQCFWRCFSLSQYFSSHLDFSVPAFREQVLYLSTYLQVFFLFACLFQDVGLDFSPGPITAEDGDKGINAPLTYTILSGQTHSHSPLDSCTNMCVQVCLLHPQVMIRAGSRSTTQQVRSG